MNIKHNLKPPPSIVMEISGYLEDHRRMDGYGSGDAWPDSKFAFLWFRNEGDTIPSTKSQPFLVNT